MNKIESFHSEEEEIRATNNFWTQLPNDNCSPIDGEPKIRPATFRDVVNRHGKIDSFPCDDVGEYWKPLHSDLFLEKTYREFFLVIDVLVEQFGLKDELQAIFDKMHDPELIEEVKSSYRISIGDDRIPLDVRLKALEHRHKMNPFRDEAIRLCLPVFRRLLEMGYTQRDLAS